MAETNNLKLALPTSNEYVDVEVLNENFRKIDTSILLALAAAAPYSAAATYAQGAYCTKDGKLYRCTVAILQAEAWNAAHWTATTVGAELVAIYTTLANNDPRQWGLGTANIIVGSRDANNCIENGWYICDVNTPTGAWWYVFTVANYANGIIVQKAWYYNDGKVIECMRLGWLDTSVDLGGGWQPWEYVNPSMALGIEYRTTERYLGKPVYVKMVDFGSLPNNTLKVVTFGDNTIRMISAHGIMDGGYVIPGCTGSSDYPGQEMQIFTGNGGNVGIFTHTDRSNIEAVIVAKYWKTTD